MLKKIFNTLALCAFFSVAIFALFLFYGKNNPFLTKTYQMENGNDKDLEFSEVPKEEGREEFKKEEHQDSNNEETLKPCPDTSPYLVGPLHVDFNSKRTLDEVRVEIGPLLQMGGRYKPTDCIARQKVAIIIAFRNRYEHLVHWVYYLHPILIRQQLDYTVYIINQDGEGVFNRAKLMNAGYVEALKEYDYDCFVFSDIDLIPLDDRNLYRCFDNPRHLAVGMDKFNFHLPYGSFYGGVSAMSKEQYLKINGFPNTYWGWGGEDDDVYNRIVHRGMSISRPDLLTGRYKMIRHSRDKHNEQNPKNPGKLRMTKQTIDIDGINSLNYTVKTIEKDKLYTFITVDIEAPLEV